MKYLFVVIGAFSAAALSGCGGEPALQASGSASLGQIQSTTFKQRIQDLEGRIKVKDNAAIPNVGMPNGIGTLMVDPYSSCKSVVVDQSQDGDSDGIYDHMKWKYDCAGLVPSAGTTETMKGTYEIIDSDPTVKSVDGGGYVMNFDIFQILDTPPAHYFEEKWGGTNKRTNTGAALVDETDMKWQTKGSDNGVRLDWSYRTQAKTVQTPANMANPYKKGTLAFSGFYQMQGDVGPDGNGIDLGSVKVTYKIEGKGLEYELTSDSGCTNYYKAGSYEFTDGSGHMMKIEYSCVGVKYYYDGTEIQGW